MFKLRRTRKVDAIEAELAAEMLSAASLLDRSSSTVKTMLDRFHDDEVALERDIADLTERLRQTRVAISAFEGAGRVLDDGKDVAVALPAKIGRLIPRAVPAEDVIVHVHKDIRA
jgi:hypothetical protein